MSVDRPCPVCETGPLRPHCGKDNRQCNWQACQRQDCKARVDWRGKRAMVDRGDAGWETVQIT